MRTVIRPCSPADEPSLLRCRTLSFLDTCYFDDVWTSRPEAPQIQLVAIDDDGVIGILDVEIEDGLAAIDTVAVHPDHRHRGIASQLLSRALEELPATVGTLDAWTREDEAALAWYHRHGFTESEHYLHVYKHWSESGDSWSSPSGRSAPVTAFCHGALADEASLRERFARVYVCRRFSRAPKAAPRS